MNTEKLQVGLAVGVQTAELIIREGDAPKVIDPKPPVKVNLSGVLGAPYEFLLKRKGAGQFTEDKCVLLVDREALQITLVTNEDDEYKTGKVIGKLTNNKKFVEFGINTGKVWSPAELGLFIKMNRSFFTDKKEAMELTTKLMNFTGEVNSKIEKQIKESGDRTDNFSQVVNSNLPPSFKVKLEIFKGSESEVIEVETFAKVDGRTVEFVLLSPGANESLEAIRDKSIDEVLDKIKELCPGIAIIEQ